jgi:hypothetical protein
VVGRRVVKRRGRLVPSSLPGGSVEEDGELWLLDGNGTRIGVCRLSM